MHTRKATLTYSFALAGAAVMVGFWSGTSIDRSVAQDTRNNTAAPPKPSYAAADAESLYLRQTPGAKAASKSTGDWGLGDGHVSRLKPYPKLSCGERSPFDLWRYAGKSGSSWSPPTLEMPWNEWVKMCKTQRPKLMADVRAYMNSRYDFHGNALPGARMSGGKPIMMGPVARLPEGIASWEELATLSPEEIKKRDLFPFKPLAHPLQTTAHMLFPDNWVRAHPEHERMDVGFDIPDAYLPEFPPPMFLTTHKELGDVSGGREVTLANYYEIFNGLLTPEQMEGLKELLRPSATTWFNHTEHRITEQASAGVACLS